MASAQRQAKTEALNRMVDRAAKLHCDYMRAKDEKNPPSLDELKDMLVYDSLKHIFEAFKSPDSITNTQLTHAEQLHMLCLLVCVSVREELDINYAKTQKIVADLEMLSATIEDTECDKSGSDSDDSVRWSNASVPEWQRPITDFFDKIVQSEPPVQATENSSL